MRSVGRPSMRSPRKRISPRQAGSWANMAFSVVLLPMPLRPSRVATLADPQFQVHAEQHLARAVAGCEVFDAQQGAHAAAPASWSSPR